MADENDIIERMARWLSIPIGNFVPSEMGGPDRWGCVLNADIATAIAEIIRLRAAIAISKEELEPLPRFQRKKS